jgi:DNA repair protein RecN (Recombination protein N)
MLTRLSIRNIVLIEAADIPLEAGLCVLTGETGAGKSILLDSLSLVLGARADASLIRHGQESGSVTAEFDVRGNSAVAALMAEMDIAADDTLIIRRAISADGKSRALVNEQPVSVTALKRLGEALVEIHGQHDQRGLMDASSHRALLDEYGNHTPLLTEVRAHYSAWREAQAALARLEEEIEQTKREEDFLRHMANELAKLAPEEGEEEDLSERRTTMMQSEKLFETLKEALGELQGGKGISQQLRSAQRLLLRSPLNSTNRFATAIDALDKAANEVDEAEVTLEQLGKEATYDPAKLEDIEERLFALKAAARKYHTSVAELPALHADAEAKLARIDSRGSALSAAQKLTETKRAEYVSAAEKLSAKRIAAGKRLMKAVETELAPLKMGNARFRARIEPQAENAWAAHGMDMVAFEAATNAPKGADIPFAPLAKIASGGELSRFMLAVKVALAELRSTATLVFDEIDTGTGGAVADAIGARLAALGKASQVLVVTHLPQVAARGVQHLLISKQQVKSKVHTSVTALGADERREELARMLAGSEVTPEARKAAARLLEQAA